MRIVQTLNGITRRMPAWPIYLLGAAFPVWLFWLGLNGQLGPEPIRALERALGENALKLLIVVLAITPLRSATGVNLIKYRRALGLLGFFYVLAHLFVWLFLDVQDVGMIWADIVKRPYVTIGMAGFVALVPLALTSNNWAIRKLGPKGWKALHRLGYLATILGGIHYIILVKGWQVTPMVYLAVILLLLGLRLPRRNRNAGTGSTRTSVSAL